MVVYECVEVRQYTMTEYQVIRRKPTLSEWWDLEGKFRFGRMEATAEEDGHDD